MLITSTANTSLLKCNIPVRGKQILLENMGARRPNHSKQLKLAPALLNVCLRRAASIPPEPLCQRCCAS